MLVVGFAVGLDELGLARLVVGVHEYVFAPLACNCIELPEQITGAAGIIEMFGLLFTVTVTVAASVQVPIVPVTIYVVVPTGGEAFGLNTVAEESPPAGVHEYEFAPPAVSCTLSPAQICAEVGLTFTDGEVFTVTGTLIVSAQVPIFPIRV